MLALGADRVIAPRRRRAQPALPDDGPVRIGVLDLRAAPPGRPSRAPRRSPKQCLPIGAAEAAPDRARRRGAPRSAGGVRGGRRSTTPGGWRGGVDYRQLLDAKRAARAADEQRKPLDAYRAEELAEMSRDIFDDRHGFSDARHAFVTKRKPASTPARIAAHRPAA